MSVILLLALIWVVVLVPPALRAQAARREAFLVSFGAAPSEPASRTTASRSTQVQRRRRIAGGLLVAMAVTLVVGLLPTFRVLLVVHLFLVDSFLAYIALLAHMANRAGRVPGTADTAAPDVVASVAPRWRGRMAGPAVLPEMGPILPLGSA